MVCFIKSVETFATIGQYDVTDYTVPLGSANGATGGITVAATLTQDYTRQWLIMDGHLFYIVSVNPDNGMTEITVGDPLSAFDRTLVYEEPSTNILGEYIRALMTSEYISLSDTAYDMPYLSVTNSDTTEFAHVYPKDGLFTLESVMRDAQSRGIRIAFTYTNDGVACTISPGDTEIHPLIIGDGHTQLASETYNRTAIAKVTVISELGYPHDYYLAVDGTVTTTIPVNRAQGEWITVKQGEENLLNTALAAFAKNIDSHKITVYSDVELELFAQVGIRVNDAVYSSRITYIGISAKDDRFVYNCGDMAVTLVDKIRSISAAADLGNISKLSELQNDVGFITDSEIPALAWATDGQTEIPANADLNNYTTPGSYFSPSSATSATMTNAPTTASRFVLYVVTMGSNFILQFAIDGYTPGNIYNRRNNAGVWGSWTQMVTSVNGDTGAVTVNVPTKVSDLTNDSGYLTSTDFARISTNFDTVSVANNTWTTVGTFTPASAGRYLIHIHVQLSSNATGYREVIVTASANGTSAISRQLTATVPAVNGAVTSVLIVGGYTLAANTTYYVRVRQNSGSALSSNFSGVEILKYPV